MKIKAGFVVREVAGKTVAVSVGAGQGAFRGMITLNGTAAFLWDALKEETTEAALADALKEAYEVDDAVALADVKTFISKLREAGLLDE